MRSFSIKSAARRLQMSTAQIHRLIDDGVVSVMTAEGEPGTPHGSHTQHDRIPEWAVAELLESPEYINRVLGE
jgi:hypothetical protein